MGKKKLEINYLKARWRKEFRYGFKLKIYKLKIEELTHLHRKNRYIIDIEMGKELLNPIVVCKLTKEQWNGPVVGNLPFRNKSLAKFLDDGYCYVVSRGNKRIMSTLKMGYEFIDGYVLDNMKDTLILGQKIEDNFFKLARRYPEKYKYSVPPPFGYNSPNQ